MKKCKSGYYYCYTDKKCKPIPTGYRIGFGGYLRPEKKNGNGGKNGSNGSNGNGGNGNGNGGGNGGSNGGGNGGGMGEDVEIKTANGDLYATIIDIVSAKDMKPTLDSNGVWNGMRMEESNPRIPRKKGQPANSKKHSDLYTDENPKGTIHGLGFKNVATAKASVSKIRGSSRSHAHKIQAAVAMEQRAREMGKTSEAAVYRKFINSMKKKTKSMNEGSLHKWFKGSKSKDGKGGWVNVVTGGTCASDEPGEGTPKCVSSSKRASMSKSERLSAARRKKKADPGQQSKSGAAKPTYVSTDSPRKKKMKKEHFDWRSEMELTESDKKGKGSGSKDACYHKVKSRYSVWPSAYASGALVKCRKVGAANWGNSSKKEEVELTLFQKLQEKCWKGYEKKGMKTMFGKRYPNCVKKEEVQRDEYGDPMGGPKISKKEVKKNLAKNEPDKQHTTDTSEGMAYGITRGSGKPSGQMAAFGKEKKKENPYSLKNKIKMVVRSVAEKERSKAGVTKEEVISERQKTNQGERQSQEAGRSNYGKASVRNVRATGMGGNAADPAERLVAMDARHKAHKEKRGVKTKGMKEENIAETPKFERGKSDEQKSKRRNLQKFGKGAFKKGDPTSLDRITADDIRYLDHDDKRGVKKKKGVKEEVGITTDSMMMKDTAKKEAMLRKKEQDAVAKKMKKESSNWRDEIELSEDDMKGMSVKSGHKRPTKSGAGMTQKGVEAYRRRNPGSKLKTAVTTEPSKLKKGSKAANRRKSYCARSAGQMKKFPKAAKDPDSRLRQARRRWNC
jgi:hypothetical protein